VPQACLPVDGRSRIVGGSATQVDGESNRVLVKRFLVEAYPSIYLVRSGKVYVYEDGPRSEQEARARALPRPPAACVALHGRRPRARRARAVGGVGARGLPGAGAAAGAPLTRVGRGPVPGLCDGVRGLAARCARPGAAAQHCAATAPGPTLPAASAQVWSLVGDSATCMLCQRPLLDARVWGGASAAPAAPRTRSFAVQSRPMAGRRRLGPGFSLPGPHPRGSASHLREPRADVSVVAPGCRGASTASTCGRTGRRACRS